MTCGLKSEAASSPAAPERPAAPICAPFRVRAAPAARAGEEAADCSEEKRPRCKEAEMDFPTEAKGWLESDIAEIASRPEECAARPGADFTRERKLPLSRLLLLLVTMGTGSVRHELMEHFRYDPGSLPTSSAFCQQRAKLLPSALRRLLRAFASRLGLREYRDGWALVAVDGSSFCFGPDRSDPATFHENREGARGHNDVHAVALYDMVGGAYVDAVVQNGREKDEFRAMCELVDDWPGWAREALRAIFVGDRGFASYNVFAHVAEAGLHFAIRAKDLNVRRMLKPGGDVALPDEMDVTVRLVLSRTTARTKVAHPERIADYRRIDTAAFDFLTEESPEYEVELRIVRFPVGDGFENVVTNLPAQGFGAEEVKAIYGMRWGIETSFRRLKLNIGAVELHSRKAAWVMQEVLARLVLYDFCAAVAAYVSRLPDVAGKRGREHAHKVNFADCCRVCCAFLRGRARGPDVEELVAGSTSPVRPGRKFHRRHRLRSPSGYAYRPA